MIKLFGIYVLKLIGILAFMNRACISQAISHIILLSVVLDRSGFFCDLFDPNTYGNQKTYQTYQSG